MTKLRTFLVLLALTLLSLAITHADSTDRAILCGALPDADCQILLDNEGVMNRLNSFAFDMSMNFSASGDDAMEMAMQGGGALSLDDDALQAINDASMDMSDSEISALIELLLTSLEGEVRFELKGSSAEEDIDLEFSLLMNDGVVLIGADALEELTGESMGGVEALGIDLNDAVGELLAETGAMPATHSSEQELAAAGVTTVTRLPDAEVNGVAVAVFETDMDLNAVLALVSAEDLIGASEDMDDPEMAQAMIDAIDVREFVVRQYIGLDDSYTYRMEMALGMTMSSEATDLETDATIMMDMTIDLSDFGEPVAVEIPEDAFIFPLAMMIAMGSQ